MSIAAAAQQSPRHGGEDDGTSWTPLRWSLGFVVILALHVGIAWVVIRWRPAEAPPSPSPPAAVMIDLAPLPTAPPAPPTEIPPGPKQEVSQPPPPKPVVQPVLPPVPPSPAPRIAIPLPPKPPPKPPRIHRRVVVHEPPKLRPVRKPPAPATTAPPQVQAPPAPTVATPAPGASSTVSPNVVPTWQGLLLSRLEQFKRYPEIAQMNREQGVVYLRFSMDRHGKVLSASIAKSSGYAALDDETLALIHRAEPLPPPPPQVPGDPITLVVPVRFFLQ